MFCGRRRVPVPSPTQGVHRGRSARPTLVRFVKHSDPPALRPLGLTATVKADLPTISADEVAWITSEQMREVDRAAVNVAGIDLLQMMELAGARLAWLVANCVGAREVTVLAGPGGNGGGGLAAARHLVNFGTDAVVVLSAPDLLSPAAQHHRRILDEMGVPIVPAHRRPSTSGIVIDALVGYSLRGPLEGPAATLAAATSAAAVVISLDLPSGLDPDTGRADPRAVMADATLTLALPKAGLVASPNVGDLYLCDIGIPDAVYRRVGIAPGVEFRRSPILHIDRGG